MALNWMVRMTSDLETNIVSVERTKEYAETATEVGAIAKALITMPLHVSRLLLLLTIIVHQKIGLLREGSGLNIILHGFVMDWT